MYINNSVTLVVPKKNYNKKKKKLKTKWYKRPKVRHTQEMKDMLKQRVKIEYVNNRIHRSFKRVHHLYEKQIV